jgi:ribosomal protein S18 acetylase RimI-like enzyme
MSGGPDFRLAAMGEPEVPEAARMNLALIADEGSQNPMGIPELEQRMRGFLAGGYRGVLVLRGGDAAGYCLWRPEEGPHGGPAGIYLRQYYIKPKFRRQGLGRAALRQIVKKYFAGAAFVCLDVLECNAAGRAFWEDFGFEPVYTRMNLDLMQN